MPVPGYAVLDADPGIALLHLESEGVNPALMQRLERTVRRVHPCFPLCNGCFGADCGRIVRIEEIPLRSG
jgi:hypothetical protein